MNKGLEPATTLRDKRRCLGGFGLGKGRNESEGKVAVRIGNDDTQG